MKVNGHHMSKEIPELKFLLSEVEKAYGRGVHTTTDFEALSVVIEHDINERLSCSTLKRLWGYVSNHSSPSLATLNILSRYVGKRDFLAFCEAIKRREFRGLPLHAGSKQQRQEKGRQCPESGHITQV